MYKVADDVSQEIPLFMNCVTTGAQSRKGAASGSLWKTISIGSSARRYESPNPNYDPPLFSILSKNHSAVICVGSVGSSSGYLMSGQPRPTETKGRRKNPSMQQRG